MSDSFSGPSGVEAQGALDAVSRQALEEVMMNVLVELLAGLLAQLQAKAPQPQPSPNAPLVSLPASPASSVSPAAQPAASQPAAPLASQPVSSQPVFTTGPASAIRPPSPNLPDVSGEPIPLELEDFSKKYHIVYGNQGWQKDDGTQLTPREEAIALRRAALLEHWNFTSVTTAANNARAAGTTLSTTNMHVFLGDAATAQPSPDQFGSRTYRMNPQWQPGQGPPPAFDANGAPIAGSVGTVVGGVNRGTRSGSSLNWPPPPATPGQLAEYDRQVNLMRAGQSIVTGVGQQSLPPPANPRTVELFVHRNQANVGLEDLNEYASRMVIDAMRCDAGAANPSNIFFGKPALLAAFKSGDAAAFAAALG